MSEEKGNLGDRGVGRGITTNGLPVIDDGSRMRSSRLGISEGRQDGGPGVGRGIVGVVPDKIPDINRQMCRAVVTRFRWLSRRIRIPL